MSGLNVMTHTREDLPEQGNIRSVQSGSLPDLLNGVLPPGGDKNTWFQGFRIPYTIILPDCGLTLDLKQKNGETIFKHYNYTTEYMPGSTSGSEQ